MIGLYFDWSVAKNDHAEAQAGVSWLFADFGHYHLLRRSNSTAGGILV